MSPAVRINGLCKRYGAVEAVRDLGLVVERGEIFGLIGPNGAGKTTTLECLLGLTAPDAGEIAVFGIDARARPAEAKQKLGAQLQSSALPDTMTPRQALRLCAAFYRRPAGVGALLEQFQLGEKADARYAGLSGGQRQRLALALAFVSQPEVVVLDEPTVGLDPPARRELHRLIAAQREQGRTILFTTHYLEEARSLCDRVAFIDHGRVVALDAPEALIAASGVRPRIDFAVRGELPVPELSALPGVVAAASAPLPFPGEGGGEAAAAGPRRWSLETAEVNRTLSALTALLERSGCELADIQLHHPTLDDAFLRLAARPAAPAP